MEMTHRYDCRICKSKDLVKFLSFGNMPLAGNFIRKDDIKNEKLFPLDVYFCRKCKEVQLLDIVSKDMLFKDYRFLASVTKTLSEHFINYAKEMKEKFDLNEKSVVVEFGSNDGVLQKPFKDLNITAIGIEPAKNIADIAKKKGLIVINDFFTIKIAESIVTKYGKADLICANNVFAHIDDMHEILESIKALLKEDGIFVFEVHYLADLIKDLQYDMIYHEHLMYHSLMSLSYLFDLFDMEIFDVLRIPIHSGSIRVYVKNKENKRDSVKKIVSDMIHYEKEIGLDREETFFKFSSDVYKIRDNIIKTIRDLRMKGKRIVGYGASGRASVHINFCNFGPEDVEYVIDMSPERQGRLIPGKHIKIVEPKTLIKNMPDFVILFAYNYEKEVLNKEKEFISKGGKFIIPIPDIRIVP